VTEVDFLKNRQKKGMLCSAPFNSLYIGQKGEFFVCCANRFYKLGSYPEQTIMEIWNGEPLKKIREEMKQMKFNVGCGHCSHNLKCGNFETLKIPFYDYKGTTKKLKYPIRLDLELDNICNLECVMCNGKHSSSIRKNREKLPKYISPYDDKFYNELFEILPHVKRVDFYGGEPFLIKGYYKILDFCREKKLKINFYLQTNGTVYNEKIESYLKELDIDVGVSIDAGTKELFEKIRVNADFDKVCLNLKKISNVLLSKNKKLTISTVVMGSNVRDLHKIVTLANSINANIYFHKLMFPENMALSALKKEEIDEIYSIMSVKKFLLLNPTEVQKSNIKKFRDLISEIIFYKNKINVKEIL
jgi:MoaA/NifB/PqqE/SkfB family radical SAM enzyme